MLKKEAKTDRNENQGNRSDLCLGYKFSPSNQRLFFEFTFSRDDIWFQIIENHLSYFVDTE